MPVIKVNTGIKNYCNVQSSFCSLIHDNPKIQGEVTSEKSSTLDKIALRTTSNQEEQKILLQAANKIARNKDIRVLLEDVINSNSPYKPRVLSKVQRELLSIHNKLNHQLSMKDIQLLAAAEYFPKRLSQCDRPQYGSY